MENKKKTMEKWQFKNRDTAIKGEKIKNKPNGKPMSAAENKGERCEQL